MLALAIFLSIALVVYAGVRGLFVWAARQPFEEQLWPQEYGLKKGTDDL